VKFIVLLLLSVLTISCTSTGDKNTNPDQISNASYLDSKNNFTELKFLFSNKKYKEANNLLADMEDKLPYSRYTKHGKILEIYSYYEQNKFSNAITKADEFINLHPTHLNLDYVYYLKAISSYNINKLLYQNLSVISNVIEVNRSKVRQTFTNFSILVQKYPKSSYVADSIAKIKKLRQVLSEYELNDAYILLDNARYQEAIEHSDFLIKNYPHSTSIPKALKLQARAYRLLGNLDTAKSIEMNLRRNYSE